MSASSAMSSAASVDYGTGSETEEAPPKQQDREEWHDHTSICESDAQHVVNVPPVDIRGRGEGSGVYCDGRLVHQPYNGRSDIGTYGVYFGNWSGLVIVMSHISESTSLRTSSRAIQRS